ncbi:hypothetical protein ACN47E_003429 [Coniothyrium glycines]
MAGPSIEIVYETDYVTVCPTAAPVLSDSVLASLTQSSEFSTSMSTIAPSSTTASAALSATTAIFASTSSVTGQPTSTELPQRKDKYDDSFAVALIIAVSLMAFLLISFLGFHIYLRFRGKCPGCHDANAQLAKWKSGELKYITTEMVRERERINGLAAHDSAHCVADSEKGMPEERASMRAAAARAEALAKLSGHECVTPGDSDASDASKSEERFFTVDKPALSPAISRPSPVLMSPGRMGRSTRQASTMYSPSSFYSRATRACSSFRPMRHDEESLPGLPRVQDVGRKSAARESYQEATWRKLRRDELGF